MHESHLQKEAADMVDWAMRRANEDFRNEFPKPAWPFETDAEFETWLHQRAALYLQAFHTGRVVIT